jgi:hypothetical protein
LLILSCLSAWLAGWLTGRPGDRLEEFFSNRGKLSVGRKPAIFFYRLYISNDQERNIRVSNGEVNLLG